MLEKAFKNEELGIEINSFIDKKLRIWFKAKEVAEILEYKNTEKAIKRHVSENHKKLLFFVAPHETHCQQNNTEVKCCPPETGGKQNKTRGGETPSQQIDNRGKYCIFLDEAGFYELVFRSRLPAAKFFREWVFTKVLPSIRKYGYYKIFDNLQSRKVIINGEKYYKHPVFNNYAASKKGNIINIKRKKILSKKKNNGNGYLIFCLCNEKLEEKKNYYQHRFVYEVFKGMIPSIMEIDHRNGVRNDNRIKNLQLLTHKQNVEKSNNRPIISTCIEDGKERRFDSIKKASIELGIFDTNISQICKGKFKKATSKKNGNKYSFRYLD